LKKLDGFKNSAARTCVFVLFFVSTIFLGISQKPSSNNNPKVTRVIVDHADSAEIRQNNSPDNILRGNVAFRHDSVRMTCDSAYYYSPTNSLDAFDNVHIIQGDTLFIYGDFLNYFGNTQLAKMRDNVRMDNKEVTLFTDSFDYDRIKNLAYYFDGGMLVDSVNELTSVYGQYSPDTKIAFFKNKVKLVNPQFTLTADTLKYQTETKIATIVGPTVIESDSGFIYTDKGWYNTVSGESMLYNRSLVTSKDKTKTITADSMAYDRTKGFVEAFGNMVLNDTVKKIILTGNYGYYDENTKYAFATDSAQMIEYSQRDSSFLHADTIFMLTIDTIREVRAYYGVRYYRTDIQSVCDSMLFNTGDSILRLFKNPVLWNDTYQLTGDTIKVLFNDSTIERMNVLNYGFGLQKIDSTYYNQLKGRSMIAYFDAGEIYQLDVEGNGEALYYNIEKKDTIPAQLSRITAPFINFGIKNRKINKIKWFPEAKLDIFPIANLLTEDKFLKDFVDYSYLRPKNREDIFVKTTMKEADIPPPRRIHQRSRKE
jgi:lipopolysaccharide export system protein LptA